jgi:hypothetical protein
VPLAPGLKVSPEWRLVLPLLQRPEAVSRLQAQDPVLQVAGVSGAPAPSSPSPAAGGGSAGGGDSVSTDNEQQQQQQDADTQVLSLDWYPPSGE